MKKAYHILIYICVLCIAVPFSVYAKQQEIKVIVDGKVIDFDQPPVIINGRTMIPMRSIFEALGCELEWIPDHKQISADRITSEEKLHVSVQIPQKRLLVSYTNWKHNIDTFTDQYMTEAPPVIINGRTLLSTRIIAESLGAKVDWDGNTRTVNISTKNYIEYFKEVQKREETGTTTPSNDKPTQGTDPIPTQPNENKPTKPVMPTEPPEVGSTPGKIYSHIKENGYPEYLEPYDIFGADECASYAIGRFDEVHGTELRYSMALNSTETWIEDSKAVNWLTSVKSTNNIEPFSIAVFKPKLGIKASGHVMFIEYVERDQSGNPLNIYFTDSNGIYDLNKKKFDPGYDGVVRKESFENFRNRYEIELVGYILPSR